MATSASKNGTASHSKPTSGPDHGSWLAERLAGSKFSSLWYFLRPYKRGVIALFVLSLLIGAADSFNIVVLYHIFNYGLNISTGTSNIFFRIFEWINNLLPIEDKFASASLFFIGLALIVALLRMVEVLVRSRVIESILTRNRNELFDKYMAADYKYYLQNKQGDLIYNAHNAPEALSQVLTSFATILSDILLAIQIFILLFSLSWWGSLAILGLGGIYYLMTRRIGKAKAYVYGKKRAQAKQGEQTLLNEVITGVRPIKIYHSERTWTKRYRRLIDEDYTALKQYTRWSEVPRIFLDLVMYSTIGVVAILLKFLFPYDFVMVLPVFGAFGYAVFRLLPRFTSFGRLLLTIRNQLPNLELMHELLDAPLQTITDGDQTLDRFETAVTFESVTFSYPERNPVLVDVDLAFVKGKMTAIVGASGSGKSTIINLLVRLFDPDSGRVCVDGTDLRTVKRASWLRRIGFVGQEPYLYNASVRDNITFGTECDDAAVRDAARKANAHEFITTLPNGYDTLLGDRGMRLSGGQMQRIAIARAILRRPALVILDEATSSLDSISEQLVQAAINDLSRECTVVVIAHRLSTIVNADRIYVIADKRVIETGTHSALLERKGAYFELYRMQEQDQTQK